MDPITGHGKPLTNPRPGHADYAGALKYRQWLTEVADNNYRGFVVR